MQTILSEQAAKVTPDSSAKRTLSTFTRRLERIREKGTYSDPESALTIAGDTKYQRMLQKKLAPFKGVTHVILVGIGGSVMATRAVFEAREHLSAKKLHVVDVLSVTTHDECTSFLGEVASLEQLAIVIVSKSGSTTETLMNARLVLSLAQDRFESPVTAQTICVTDDTASLAQWAKKQGILTMQFPSVIGGRFSSFTAASIVPLTLLGVDVSAFLKGGATFLQSTACSEVSERILALAALASKGVRVINFFSFDSRLARLGFWYEQLVAESLGKPKTNSGKPFKYQLLPITSTSAELHSKLQLYLGGYKGIFTHFVRTEASENELVEPHESWLFTEHEYLAQHTRTEVQRAVEEGVLHSYTEARHPYAVTTFEHVSTFELGAFMAGALYEVMALGALFDVSVFGQPEVEGYKKHTLELLSKQK